MESTVEKKQLDKRITLNVGGQRHETWASTLERLPGTRLALLANLLHADQSWDSEHKEYFFDRHAGAFGTVIHFYRTEELHPDQSICGNVMKAELEFWGLSELDIEPCCWGHYSKFKDHKDTLAALDDNFTSLSESDLAWGEKKTNAQRFRIKIWRFLEDPGSSRWAKLYAVVSMFFVALSIGVFVLETHSLFRVPEAGTNTTDTGNDVVLMGYYTIRDAGSSCCCPKKMNKLSLNNSTAHPAMVILDYICAAFFTIELIARIGFAPRKVAFFKELLNVIDIICLIPQFTAIIIKTVNPEDTLTNSIFKTILALRIIRILRIFKLMKHYSGFKILVYTIKVSTKELFLIVIFLFMGVLIFASVIFYIDNETFDSIPIGFWWALVTMTTVGYGDKVPNTEFGYIIGSLCVICGVLTIAFTVPIVVNNFTLYYSHAQSRIKLPISKRKQIKKRNQSRIKKNNMDLIKKECVIGSFTNLDQMKSPRNSMNSGIIEVRPAQHTGCHLDAISEASSETLTTSTTVGPDTPPLSRANIEDNLDERRDNTSSRLRTVSGSLDDIDLRLSLPLSSRLSDASGSQLRLESEQLLSGLAESTQRMEDERERQLDRVRQRRENLRGHQSRPSPSPDHL